MDEPGPGPARGADLVLGGLRREEQKRKPVEGTARHERLSQLGAGGMGVVWKAREVATGRLVAIKELRGEINRETLIRFVREADSLARLSHPNIVGFVEVIERPLSIVMEHVDGETLATLLARRTRGRMDLTGLLVGVARGVHHAHEQGIVHRDLKPANVIVTAASVPKVADFGIARLADGEHATLTQTGVLLGTPHYMSPEQAAGDAKHVDARSDTFTLGVMLYEVLTGRLPHQGGTGLAILDQIRDEVPRPPREIDSTIPRELEAIALRAIAKAPEQRYQTAAAFADDLERALAPRSAPPATRPPGKLLAVAVLASVVALAAVAAREARRGPGALEDRGSEDPAPLSSPMQGQVQGPPAVPTRTLGLEARLRAGQVAPGELEALARAPASASLLDRLAADAVVLPLVAIVRAEESAAPRNKAPLALLEAVALIVSESRPEEGLARAKGLHPGGVSLTFLDAVATVLRVRAQVEAARSPVALLSNHASIFTGDELASLAPLVRRPDLLAAALSPLAPAFRAALIAEIEAETHLVFPLVRRLTFLAPFLERIPAPLALAYVIAREEWPLAARIAPALEDDPVLAGRAHALAFATATLDPSEWPRWERDVHCPAARRLLGAYAAGECGTETERHFACWCLHDVEVGALRHELDCASIASGAAARSRLEAATVTARRALDLRLKTADVRGQPEDAHRLAILLCLLDRADEARRTPTLDSEDLVATLDLPSDARVATERATRIIQAAQAHRALEVTPWVKLTAFAVRSRLRSLAGDAEGAARDDAAVSTATFEDAWLARRYAELVAPEPPRSAPNR